MFQTLQNCFGPPAWVGPSSVETHADFAPDSGNETQTTGGAPWSRETPTRQAKQKRIQYVLLGVSELTPSVPGSTRSQVPPTTYTKNPPEATLTE